MLITLIYLVIGAILMGGIYLVHPEIIDDNDLDDIFFVESLNINYVIGAFLFLAVMMIWLPVLIAVIISYISRKIKE